MNKKEVVLENGVKLLLINTNKFKTVNINLFFEDELNDFNITVNNLLLKLLTTKTNKHPSRQAFKTYLRELYDMGIKSSKLPVGDTFSFSLGMESINKKYTLKGENLLEKQFEILNEILYSPLMNNNLFDEEYFKEIKNDSKQNLINNENSKEYVVCKKVNEILGKNNKLFVLSGGYLDVLEKISNEDVSKQYTKLNTMCKKIIVCGEIDFVEVERYINTYLHVKGVREEKNYLYKNEFKKYKDESYDSKFSQSSIAILYDLDIYINDPMYYAAVTFVEMFNYYLFKVVREEYNFCYSIYTSYLSSKGLCILQSNIESKNYEKTLEVIDEIINGLKSNIDDKVLDISKKKIINNYRKEIDNPNSITIKEYERDLFNLKSNEEIIKIYENLKGDEIREVAKKLEKKFSVILKEEQ